MIKLNLETNNEAEERIKAYLEDNVSEMLADKINNGVQITKNEKILTNKKTLSGFMKYASTTLKKIVLKANFIIKTEVNIKLKLKPLQKPHQK